MQGRCMREESGMGGGCALASILLSTLFLPRGPCSVQWGRKNVEHYEIQISGAKCTFIYIYIKELNVKTRILPRSSFSSFCKKRNR